MTQDFVFFGHHKCGSRFLRQVFSGIGRSLGRDVVAYKCEPLFHFRRVADLDLCNVDFSRLGSERPIILNLANTNREIVAKVRQHSPDYRGLRVIRDPRQVLVSNYFHHKGDHPIEGSTGWYWDQLAEDKPRLNELSLEDGLLYEMGHISRDVLDDQLFSWEPDPRVMETRLEDIRSDGEGFLRRLSEWLDLDVAPSAGPSHENADSRDWREVFTPKVAAAFKSRWGTELIATGYASDLDW